MAEKHRRFKIVLEVVEINGECPVYKLGHKMTIDEPMYILKETDGICIAPVAQFYPYLNSLLRGIDPMDLGIAKEGGDAYLTCVAPRTDEAPEAHGNVIFKVHRIPIEKSISDKFYEDLMREEKAPFNKEFAELTDHLKAALRLSKKEK